MVCGKKARYTRIIEAESLSTGKKILSKDEHLCETHFSGDY